MPHTPSCHYQGEKVLSLARSTVALYAGVSWKYLFINLLVTQSAVQFHCMSLEIRKLCLGHLFGQNKILIKKLFSYLFTKLFINHKFLFLFSSDFRNLVYTYSEQNTQEQQGPGSHRKTSRGQSTAALSCCPGKGGWPSAVSQTATCCWTNSHLTFKNKTIKPQDKQNKQTPNPRDRGGLRQQKQQGWVLQFPSLQAGQAPKVKWGNGVAFKDSPCMFLKFLLLLLLIFLFLKSHLVVVKGFTTK